MVNADGTLKKDLFTPDNIHLTQDGGYALYAGKLKPLVEAILGGKPPASPTAKPKRHEEAAPPAPARKPEAPKTSAKSAAATSAKAVHSAQVLTNGCEP
jgi:hypothetical protein